MVASPFLQSTLPQEVEFEQSLDQRVLEIFLASSGQLWLQLKFLLVESHRVPLPTSIPGIILVRWDCMDHRNSSSNI